MKLDKETVVKHQFWFLLGGFLLLWLIGLISLKVAAAGPIAKKKADFTSALNGVKGARSKAKNESFWKPWEDYGAKYDGYKKDAWQKAWTLQQYVETWPQPLDQKMFYPQDPMDDTERGNYQQNWYGNQFKDLEQIAFPVQYAGGFSAVFPQQKWTDAKLPTREEIWLAQEDVWVRREMLYILREAMDSVARFEEVGVDEKKEPVKEGHQRRRFRNYYFEIDLVIGPGKEGKRPVITTLSTIKNISKDNRVLPLANPRTNRGIPFYLYQGANNWALFRLEGEPLAPQAEKPTPFTKAYAVTGIDLRKPFVLVQGFEWENCPIRALEEITLAKNCSRLEKVPLKVRDILKVLDAPPEAKEGEKPEGEGGSQPGGMPGGAPGGMPGPPGGMPGGPPGGMRSPAPPGQGSNQMGQGGTRAKGAAHVPDPTPVNKIDRKRYLHVTPQCRQLPIKLRLIIEQPHIQNVLAAIANNRLRIQITQVEIEHVGSVKATGLSDFVPGEQPTAGRMPPGMPPGMPPKGSGPGFRGSGGGPPAGMPASPPPPGMAPPGGSGAGPMSPPPPGAGSAGGMPRRMPPMTGTGTPTGTPAKPTDVKDPNMVTLTVYGIAALYERFPPKAPPAPPAEGGTSP